MAKNKGFSGNKIGNNFSKNNIQGEFSDNTIGDDFTHNKIKEGKRKTKIVAIIGLLTAIIGVIPILYSGYKSFRTRNFCGQWKVTCHIKSSTYKAYIGKSAGYKIYFTQDGDKVNGKGEMFWVDNKEIPYEQHIPIVLEGKINGEIVDLTYTQNGAKRTTIGEIKLRMNSEGLAGGDFSGTAADSKGTVIAEMIE